MYELRGETLPAEVEGEGRTCLSRRSGRFSMQLSIRFSSIYKLKAGEPVMFLKAILERNKRGVISRVFAMRGELGYVSSTDPAMYLGGDDFPERALRVCSHRAGMFTVTYSEIIRWPAQASRWYYSGSSGPLRPIFIASPET